MEGPRVARGRTARVLVVDDSADHRGLMARVLERAGFEVRVAADADGALSAVDDVELVLLDYRMPGLSGLDLLALLRARPRPPSVVMVTGLGSTDVAVGALRAGAIDYVAKEAGYLDRLPDVIRRAWRQHDLGLRAAELQRMALVVSSGHARDVLFGEVVDGARRLLHARTCVLLLAVDGRLEAVTQLGTTPDDLDVVTTIDVGALDPLAGPVVEGGRVLVPLAGEEGRPVGLLAVWCDVDMPDDEELALAQAFGSFAGIALRNLRQRELEGELVAELEQTVDARRDFVSSVSHELRTPLACIIGFAETLTRNREALTPEMQQDITGRILTNAKDLEVLIEQLLELATLDPGRTYDVQLGEVVLAEVVAGVLSSLSDVLADRDVAVDLTNVPVAADTVLLRRILDSLLTNAVKFSAPGSPIRLRATANDRDVLLEVEDEGRGLSPREAARVFDPFFRGRSAMTDAVQGQGVGLALTREYARTMQGRVGVRSEVGVGSTFWVALPVWDGRLNGSAPAS